MRSTLTRSTLTRSTLTLTAAVVINVLALAFLSWSVSEAQLTPQGEVTITQLAE